MSGVHILTCEFKSAIIPKKVIAHMASISPTLRLKFSKLGMTIYSLSSSMTSCSEWKIGKESINYQWMIDEDEDEDDDYVLECEIANAYLKKAWKSAKKSDPLVLDLYRSEDENKEVYKLSMQLRVVTMNRDGAAHVPLNKSESYAEVNIKESNLEFPCVFIGAKDLEKEISAFDKNPIEVLMFDKAMIILSKSVGQRFIQTANFGEMTESENKKANLAITNDEERKDLCLNIPDISETLKTLCKIYDSPVSIFYQKDKALTFNMYPSCYGELKLSIKPEE